MRFRTGSGDDYTNPNISKSLNYIIAMGDFYGMKIIPH